MALPGTKAFLSSCFLFIGKRLQPPILSLISKGQIQTVAMPAHLENLAMATELEKGQFLFQSQRMAMSKNVQIAIQLY